MLLCARKGCSSIVCARATGCAANHQPLTPPPPGRTRGLYVALHGPLVARVEKDGRARPLPGVVANKVALAPRRRQLAAAPADAPNPGDRELRIEGARRLDFVMTDGHGNWDTPVPSYAAHGGNGHGSGSDSDGGGGKASPSFYSIEEPGTWRLKSGKLTKQ